MNIQPRLVRIINNQQILGQRQLPLAKQGIRLGEQLLGLGLFRIRCIALTADSQQQGVHACDIHGMNRLDSRDKVRDRRPGHFMDQGTESRVFLRRPANGSKRPDCSWSVIYMGDPHDREVMDQAVIAKMVPKGTLRPCLINKDMTAETEISLRRCQQTIWGLDHLQAMAAKQAGKRQLRHAFRQRHDRSKAQAGRTADKNVDRQRLPLFQGRGMMNTDTAMNLVMQAGFVAGILIAGNLHAVHSQVGASPAFASGSFGIDLRQSDKRATVIGPGDELRQLGQLRALLEQRAVPHFFRQQIPDMSPKGEGGPHIAKGQARINLIRDQAFDNRQGVPEEITGALQRTEQVSQHREAAIFDIGKQQRRAAVCVHPALDDTHLKIGIDFDIDPLELARSFQVSNGLL